MKTAACLRFATIASTLLTLSGPIRAQAMDESGLPPAPPGNCWKQIWGDDFNGDSIDTTKWLVTGHQERPNGTGIWQADHVQVHDGLAHFLVSRNPDGKLTTEGIQSNFATTYGFFVMRAKLPKMGGYRPGFWLSSDKINTVNDPTHPTEIDILEQPTRDGRIRQNLHWNGYAADHKTVGQTAPNRVDFDQFHTYAMQWSPDSYHFFIDGKLTWVSSGGGISSGPEFIRLGNEPFDARSLRGPQPSDQDLRNADGFQVDYVRIYQPQGCP